jgi:hypothetical protein
MSERERARQPEDLARLFVQRANARDADGLAELYEPDAVMAYPQGRETVGRGRDPRRPGAAGRQRAGVQGRGAAADRAVR